MHMMKNNGERSLKSLNMKWLALLAAADVLFVLLFVAPDLLNGVTMTQIGVGRVLTTTMMPVVVVNTRDGAFFNRTGDLRVTIPANAQAIAGNYSDSITLTIAGK